MSNEPRELPRAAIKALEKGNIIDAIKAVRTERKLGLKESKELVEAYIDRHPEIQSKLKISKSSGFGCFVVLLVIAFIAAVLIYLRMK